MSETKRSHNQHGGSNSVSVHHDRGPYWRRAHRDWRIWVGVLVMLAAMMIYVLSENLAWRPDSHRQRPPSGAMGK